MSHWYRRDSTPCYELPKKGGGFKSVTLREARQLHLTPSVTTVLKVMDKPALNDWRVKEGIKAAMAIAYDEAIPLEDYIAECFEESYRAGREAADRGTLIHDAIEASFKGKPYADEWTPYVEAARGELFRLFPGVDDWVAEEYFAHPIGFGGKVDLYSPSTGIWNDWKTKDGPLNDGKRLAYDQNIQGGAYRLGLQLPRGACGSNIFISRDVPGAVASHVWTPQEVDEGEEIFLACLALWKLIKKYDGSFSEADNGQQ